MTRLTASMGRSPGRMTSQLSRRKLPVSVFLPIPTGGLDAISPLTNMPPDRAIVLDNWFPQLRYIELRRGHIEHSDTGSGEPVESLMAYNALATASDKLFAAADGEIFDVTTGVSSSQVTTLTNNRWQHINFATSGGNFLMCVNGADGVRYFDGANWATATITGVTAADLIHIAGFKNRVWFVEKDSLDAWFLPTDSIQGKATRFPLGGTMKEGGFLMAIATWSLDGGDGPDDRIAFISSEGEVAVYGGSDPTNSATFALQGVYKIGNPIGRRCFFKVGGDVAVICIDGVVPLSKAMVVERGAALTVAITASIQPLLNDDARNFSDIFGWQLISYPRGTRAILNVPSLVNETSIQYVMNTVSGAWCRFTGMNANCWEVFQERIFFGGNAGVVMEADTGGDDNGEPISTDVRCAFNDCNEQRQKLFVMARPFIISDGDVSPGIAINVDFRDTAQVDTQPVTIDAGAEWDEAIWDVSEWPIEGNLIANWVGLAAMEGNTVSIRMAVSAQASGTGDVLLQLIAFQILFIPGAYI